ncbi:MAG TPA: UDP-N-acetylglucosamine 2-epimerase (non-hydrolyzing) [Thermoplasmata archaeon]|nr:UDP-N-acetylglucosamine 2-epimerase (non-hydrolyzing) [Thermoplasmata archaeon]
MVISIVVGTRPEVIKQSPIIRELGARRIDFFILHTGQHYSYELDEIFFKELKLPMPRYNLKVGSGSHARQTARMLEGIGGILAKERPSATLVEGDTNSVLAGALAATKLNCKVGHVEAGLRSWDPEMPEEINRKLADHCSDYLFAPTKGAKRNLINEGISEEKIWVTGNTVVDAIHQNITIATKRRTLEELGLEEKNYFLVTLHRVKSVDSKERFKSILKGLEGISNRFPYPVVYPIHPRAMQRIKDFQLEAKGVRLTSPVGYLDFLNLEKNARLILTDSGGVQEEACVLKVPCITLRDSTERPETLEVHSNLLAGYKPSKIVDCATEMLEKRSWENPFGDGKAGKRIVSVLERI